MSVNKELLKNVKYGKYKQAKIRKEQDGSMTLDLPPLSEEEIANLPTVSVVTITKDRSAFISSMLYMWSRFMYDPEKLEWVILDDSQDPNENIADYLPDDPRIKYFKIKEWMPIDKKRNAANNLTSHEIIVHMDDDDFYFPDSILAKVKTMLHYKCKGVMSFEIGVYDLINHKSFILAREHQTNVVPEATLAYYKSYWEGHPFESDHNKGMGEGEKFIYRFKDWVDIHFLFTGICITHNKNITENTRSLKNEDEQKVSGDFMKIFPENYKLILNNIENILISK